MKILSIAVVEDHDDLRELTVDFLNRLGHSVFGFSSAEDFDEFMAQHSLDLLIADINLPGEDGLSLCARVREACPHMGIILLTARNQPTDHVKGYNLGADVYLDKPTSNEELIAAIQSLARRLHPPEVKTLKLMPLSMMMVGPLGSVQLTDAELKILKGLTLAPDRRMPYWQVLDILGLPNDESGKSAMEVRVVRLRKKLQDIGAPKPSIQSVYRFGYQSLAPMSIEG
jgi:DNA-binding response OmpR family regulator